jgi:glycosyltransferase involved in cell wall biosynthesis
MRRVVRMLSVRRYDVVWIEGEVLPYVPALAPAILARLGVPYVADYDDALFHRYELHRRAPVRALLGGKIDRVMRHAAAVTVGNDYLAARAYRACARRVEILPSAVDIDRFAPAAADDPQEVVVGWMGSPSTARYLPLVAGALATATKRGMRVVVVGAGDDLALPGVPCERQMWTADTEVAQLQSFAIGIMPLVDGPWERGKCGYKLVQYMACGKPVVASPVGTSCQLVEHGRNGFLATSPGEWVTALTTLASDAELRRRLGAAGRLKVESEFAAGVVGRRIAAILRDAAGR